MEQIPASKKEFSDKVHDASSTARNATEQFISNVSDKASRLFDKTSDSTSEYMTQASSWAQKNYGKTLAVVGVLTLVGVAGYFLGRSAAHSSKPRRSESFDESA